MFLLVPDVLVQITISRLKTCPDILDFDSFGVIRPEPFDCFPMYLKPLKDEPLNSDRLKYKAIHRCPEYGVETDVCATVKEGQTFTDILPVTDRTTNIIYINAPCAMCNNIIEENLVFWNVKMSCDEREVQAYRTETELINFYAERSSCNMKYSLKKGDGVKADVCPPVIRKCNESGNWKTFDPFISSACSFYENRYSIEVEVGTQRYIYR